MPKSYYYTTIVITIIIIIVIYPLSPTLAHGQYLPYQTITIKNQINNSLNRPTSDNFSTYTRAGENNNNNNNNNSANHISNISTNRKIAILNFYDDVKTQFTNAQPILDKYGFKGTFFIVCNWAGAVRSQTPRMTWQDIN